MRFLIASFSALMFSAATSAQTDAGAQKYFPAKPEFPEIHAVLSEENFSDSRKLSKIDKGWLISDVGFNSYARRDFSLSPEGEFSAEVITLRDSRAAYSLLTLLRNGSINEGPPGDAFASSTDGLCFAQGNKWIRIRSRGVPHDLLMRIAASISTRIGGNPAKPPSLVSRLIKTGCDSSSLRYFPSSRSFVSYSGKIQPGFLKLDWDPEIAQARCSADGQTGNFFLLNFPTWELAEHYHSEMAEWIEGSKNRIYWKRVGPLLGILDGTFYPETADRILSSITYQYSIQWIAGKKSSPATVWGIPVAILRTVVWSAFLVVLLGGLSVLAGVAIAAFRLMLRSYAPNNPLDRPERTEITHLRLR